MDILEIAERAASSAPRIAESSNQTRNMIIHDIAKEIELNREKLKNENAKDVQDASKEGLRSSVVHRLKLDDSKIDSMIKGLTAVAKLDDPINRTIFSLEMDHGLELYKLTCPIGVVAAIFESRPDALVQITSLCIKAANAVILKGGKEAHRSNRILVESIRNGIRRVGNVPENSVQLIETRQDIDQLLKLDKYVDLILPRGSSSLVNYVKENSRIPVLGHSEGLCHEYVDVDADLDMAAEICYDAKVQNPSPCNALNTVLVHESISEEFLPSLAKKLELPKVEIRGDELTRRILPQSKAATNKDWSTEFLDLIIAVKVVDSLDEAITHINRYSAHHTDGIITENAKSAKEFLKRVNSSVVLHNASTRFSDGYRFGFGAEVGISTGKFHARGPVGLEGLVTYKFIVAGSGQLVSTYVGSNPKPFTHKKLQKTWNP